MKQLKTIAAFLILTMLLSVLPVTAHAAEPLGFDVTLSNDNPAIGEEVTVVVSLTGYTADVADEDLLRAVQVDITGVDEEILEVVSYETMIQKEGALSNTPSYNKTAKRVRLMYVEMTDTLPPPCEDLLKVVFRIHPNLTESGSITLPVTAKLATVSQNITLTGECTINYVDNTAPVVSVDISWGSLNYTYNAGIWNSKTHNYVGAGWTDGGSGYVRVKNTGNIDLTAAFDYQTERTDITGSFVSGASPVTEPVLVEKGLSKTVSLRLQGKPTENLDSAVIGTVTVTIGGE